jgi:hypothetical protein
MHRHSQGKQGDAPIFTDAEGSGKPAARCPSLTPSRGVLCLLHDLHVGGARDDGGVLAIRGRQAFTVRVRLALQRGSVSTMQKRVEVSA